MPTFTICAQYAVPYCRDIEVEAADEEHAIGIVEMMEAQDAYFWDKAEPDFDGGGPSEFMSLGASDSDQEMASMVDREVTDDDQAVMDDALSHDGYDELMAIDNRMRMLEGALENCSEALDNILAHYGKDMTDYHRQSGQKIVAEAKALLVDYNNGQDDI